MANIEPVSAKSIDTAAGHLHAGRLVAFPTETVYGLGADATDDRAVAEIFAAKNRPDFNPLIVHVPDRQSATAYVDFNLLADSLADAFWPGPLTLILPRSNDCTISALASAGLDTVAIRIPGDTDARQLIEVAGCPIAAPSANRSGRLSPTEASHVADQLGDQVALILDGGPCAVGLESTVVDACGKAPTILRPGGITAEDIERVLGVPVAQSGETSEAPKSPGMLASHYAPSCPLRIDAAKADVGEALLGFGPDAIEADLNLSPSGDLVEAAANLFAFLHRLDTPTTRAIAVMAVPDEGLGRAINDRLKRAAT
ncbi:MAG: threonylcarbamoyl-AMP synthase [Rhodospirillaceae bacterium]|nr:threonylcarbamoyl-AMP synthase [Rhodospirillaceae bacterium]